MSRRIPIDLRTHHQLVALHELLGERECRRMLGDLSPEAYARALARLPQQQGTLALIRQKLAASGECAA